MVLPVLRFIGGLRLVDDDEFGSPPGKRRFATAFGPTLLGGSGLGGSGLGRRLGASFAQAAIPFDLDG